QDDSDYFRIQDPSVVDRSEVTEVGLGSVFRVLKPNNTHNSDAVRWLQFSLYPQTKPYHPSSAVFCGLKDGQLVLGFKPSWLSVLGMPAISHILNVEKYGLLRFSVPLFVLIILSYLL
ncbi:MAG: hypothetical protein JSS50_05440, partial [Proteobacteria bacterium]|nr:hypothetical protein [Pseudomonadota bacterium]